MNFNKNTNVKVNMNKSVCNEFILYNAIDKDFLAIIKPLNFLQSIVLQFKYVIKNGFITPLDNFYKSCIILSNSLLFILFVSTSANVIQNIYDDGLIFVCLVKMFNILFYGFILIVISVDSIRYDLDSVYLILKMQSIFRMTKLYKNKSAILIFWNWLYFAGLLIFSVTYSIIRYTLSEDLDLGNLIFLYIDVNIIYAMRVISMLQNEVLLLNSLLVSNEYESAFYNTRTLSDCYFQIMDSYAVFMKIFHNVVKYILILLKKIFNYFENSFRHHCTFVIGIRNYCYF